MLGSDTESSMCDTHPGGLAALPQKGSQVLGCSKVLQKSPGHGEPDKNFQSLMKHRTALFQIYLPGSTGRQTDH